ncbi:uncharacterized protein LOC114245366 [Bombyx mandarina]|uniref:Uncharacterized protein LOC114245366 n=1 Tax=Bombyx mandarina TaxID=7092 RepID=A0A6J2JVD3_BOMMA|nr:uncharacterized protein LOC114245366 [Bombyx mandarina]
MNVSKIKILVKLIFIISNVDARIFCEKNKMPLEVGEWHKDYKQMDSAIVENSPVTINEGQLYVYENYFPGHTIKYIHVDNLAIRSCGASASIKNGGVGTSSVLIVLHADSNQEIRSVIDIWGVKNYEKTTRRALNPESLKNMKSLYLFKELRAVNHNGGFWR